jgi:hypothetical protein
LYEKTEAPKDGESRSHPSPQSTGLKKHFWFQQHGQAHQYQDQTDEGGVNIKNLTVQLRKLCQIILPIESAGKDAMQSAEQKQSDTG